jgi:hypothetical protein
VCVVCVVCVVWGAVGEPMSYNAAALYDGTLLLNQKITTTGHIFNRYTAKHLVRWCALRVS